MIAELGPAALLTAMAILVVAAAIQSTVGFGANILAVPPLLLLDPRLVPGPIILALLGVNLTMVIRNRRATSFGPIGTVLSGRLVGTAVGIWALTLLSDDGLAVLVAVLVLAIVAVTAIGLQAPRTRPNLITAGLVSGFSASTAALGGPPIAVLYADADGPEIRGSLGALFFAGNVVSLLGLAAAGLLGWDRVVLGLVLAPAAFIGFGCSRWLVPVLDRGHTRTAVLSLSAAAAIGLLIRLTTG